MIAEHDLITDQVTVSGDPFLPVFISQSALLDLYVKSVLMSKTKPQQHLLDKSGSLLRHVTHSEFKELLLPSLQKTMLRSPENAMQSETPSASRRPVKHQSVQDGKLNAVWFLYSHFLPAVCRHSGPQPVCHGHRKSHRK